MSFLKDIFTKLSTESEDLILQELHDPETRDAINFGVTGLGLLKLVAQARAFLAARKLNKGERCALLAHNGIRWVAMDLAMIAEGLIVVPLYARQAPAELVSMMKDCSPALICCGDAALRDAIVQNWPGAPLQFLFDDIFSATTVESPAVAKEIDPSDLVTIIYTSGTSGDAKGVMLNAGNISYILGCTSARFDSLMEGKTGQDRVFHYLPFSFCASRIALFTYLLRGSLVILNTDLSRIASEMPAVNADYFLNVPALLERTRKAVDAQLSQTGGVALQIYNRAKAAWQRKQAGQQSFADRIWLIVAKAILFPKIRKQIVGSNLKALISGSAPLAIETQQYFMMLGIPVLQVYGLTETTGICTTDDPHHVVPGRVGPAIPGIEMKTGANDEIVVRGPNIFPGYWNRPQETAQALRDGWFHTGDQGEADAHGNWQITGRVKNLIVLSSGHKFSPEAIEEQLLQSIVGAQHVVLFGNGHGYLCAIISGHVNSGTVQTAMDSVNALSPHYKQVRAFHLSAEPFSIDNGLLTANGKLKRDLIAEHFRTEIGEMYLAKQAS